MGIDLRNFSIRMLKGKEEVAYWSNSEWPRNYVADKLTDWSSGVAFFEEQYHVKMLEMDYAVIYQIPKSISDDENEAMSRLLD